MEDGNGDPRMEVVRVARGGGRETGDRETVGQIEGVGEE